MMFAAATTDFDMMSAVIRTGVENVQKTWKPLEVKGKVLRALIQVAPFSLVERFTASRIDAVANSVASRALWFDGARDWLEQDQTPCDGEMLLIAQRVQSLISQIRQAQGPTLAIIRLSEQHESSFSRRFRTSVHHFERASQQLLVSLADMHRVMVERCLSAELISEAQAVSLVGSPELAAAFRRIESGTAVLREGRLGSSQLDAELLAEARQTLESIASH